MKTRKLILNILFVITFVLLSAAFVLILKNASPAATAFAEINKEAKPDEAFQSGETLQISGDTQVHRGETVTYTVQYQTDPSSTFLSYELDRNDIATVGISSQGPNCYYYPVTISADALPGTTFTLTVTNVINQDSTSITATVIPAYATAIGDVVASVDGKVIGVDINYAYPGDVVDVFIQNFETENGEVNDVTYGNLSLVLDSTSTDYANINSPYTQITVKQNQPADNPIIKFTVVVMQPFAPSEYMNLQKSVEIGVYIPINTIDVAEKNRAVDRDSTVECTVTYNSDNIASEKGFTHSLFNENDLPLSSSPYFEVDWNGSDIAESYSFNVTIAKNAPYGSKLKIVLTSVADLSKKETVELSVKELETSYTLKYSKDYQGITNPNNGIQLRERGNVTQLRANYNADILFEGVTTRRLYAPNDLLAFGVAVNIEDFASSYCSIDITGKMHMDRNAPAYTNGNRTAYNYTVAISDGTRNYSQIKKSVEVYIPLTAGGVQSLRLLSNSSVVTSSNNYMVDLSYNIVAVMLGTNFTARPIDLTYTVSNSLFKITKDMNINTVTISTDNPDAVGNGTFTITVRNSTLYNELNMDNSWSDSLTVRRGFITTESHLNYIRNYTSGNYKLHASIYLDKNDKWSPIGSFYGVLDGNNYSISDLAIKNYSDTSSYMFGFIAVNYGTIKNLCISQGAFSFYDWWYNDNGAFDINYSNVPLYCGFIAAKNYGTISNCESIGSFFQFSYISSDVEAYTGAICGYNTKTVENCEVFESSVQLKTGFAGGVVGYNSGGTINNCSIALSSVSCYQQFDNTADSGYAVGHYGAAGGIAGYSYGGRITNCTVHSDVDINYNGFNNNSRELAPELGIITGRSENNVYYSVITASGKTRAMNGLNVITWTTGALWWKETHTWDQAQFVGGNVGRFL